MSSLAEAIRSSIQDLHDRIERLPLTQRIATSGIDRSEYARLLGQLACIHLTLEVELARQPVTHAVYSPAMNRAEVVERDLVHLGVEAERTPVTSTLKLQGCILHWSQTVPWALLGSLYIFEGSRMGSMVLARALAKAFDLPAEPGNGLDYHLDASGQRTKLWRHFKETLNGLPWQPAQVEEIVAAATTTMQLLYDLYAELGTATGHTQEFASPQATDQGLPTAPQPVGIGMAKPSVAHPTLDSQRSA